jgi:hypothetical protein
MRAFYVAALVLVGCGSPAGQSPDSGAVLSDAGLDAGDTTSLSGLWGGPFTETIFFCYGTPSQCANGPSGQDAGVDVINQSLSLIVDGGVDSQTLVLVKPFPCQDPTQTVNFLLHATGGLGHWRDPGGETCLYHYAACPTAQLTFSETDIVLQPDGGLAGLFGGVTVYCDQTQWTTGTFQVARPDAGH